MFFGVAVRLFASVCSCLCLVGYKVGTCCEEARVDMAIQEACDRSCGAGGPCCARREAFCGDPSRLAHELQRAQAILHTICEALDVAVSRRRSVCAGVLRPPEASGFGSGGGFEASWP